MLKKHVFTIAFISWMVFVTWSSLFSFSDNDLPKIEIPFLDKIVHFTFYFVATILGILFLRENASNKIGRRKAVIFMVLGTILYGILIEVLQYAFTLDRNGDPFDALANITGSFCGAMVAKTLFSFKSKLKWND